MSCRTNEDTLAECDPDGIYPCCTNSGECIHASVGDCFCDGCIDYRIVRDIRKSGKNCSAVRIGGFLKTACIDKTMKQLHFRCTQSDEYYYIIGNRNQKYGYDYNMPIFSNKCKDDPGVYQACGFVTNITRTDVLCQVDICRGVPETIYKTCIPRNCNRSCPEGETQVEPDPQATDKPLMTHGRSWKEKPMTEKGIHRAKALPTILPDQPSIGSEIIYPLCVNLGRFKRECFDSCDIRNCGDKEHFHKRYYIISCYNTTRAAVTYIHINQICKN